MKYFYSLYSKKYIDEEIVLRFVEASKIVHNKLLTINLFNLGLSEYTIRYLKEKIFGESAANSFQCYNYLLSLLLHEREALFNEYAIVDYGGGSGLISFIAKAAGIKKVIYCDIYDISAQDTRKLSDALGFGPDEYVVGDIDDLSSFIEEKEITVNGICSYDTIEHIYNINAFFDTLSRIKSKQLKIVLASAANTENYLVNRRLRNIQKSFENVKRQPEPGHKKRDTLEDYFSARKDIILAYKPAITENIATDLTRKTRGLMKGEIIHSTDEYLDKGHISYIVKDPTNTCDPYTGNWCEKLMDLNELIHSLTQLGFNSELLPGIWFDTSRPFHFKRVLLNKIIKLLGRYAMPIAPYYILYGTKR